MGVGGIPLFVNFFSLLIVSEYYLKYWKCAICDGIHWHFVEMTKSRVVCEKTLFGVLEMHYKVCFSFSWFYLFAYQCLFLCATCLHSEHLHFASKSVEFFNASLNRWSVKDKLTLDLSHYIWKSVVGVGDISCCKFFLIVKGVQYPKFSNLVKKLFFCLIGSIKQLRIMLLKFGIDNKTFNMFLNAFWWNFELTARCIPGN